MILVIVKEKGKGIVIDVEYNDDWMKVMRDSGIDLHEEIDKAAKIRFGKKK